MRILHLADLHLAAGDAWQYGLVDTAARLQDVLAAVPQDFVPDVVVVAGDISNDDSAASYDRALELVGGHADALGVPLVWAPGNHDRAEHYRRLPQGEGVIPVPGGAIGVLDTRAKGRGHGRMPVDADAVLSALSRVRGERVVVMHHPPLPAPTALHHALRLRGAHEWTDRIAEMGIAAILCGHYHLAGIGEWGGAAVVVAPAVANQTVATAPWGTELAVARHGVALVDTADIAGTRFVHLGADEPQVVLRMDHERVALVAAHAGAADEPGGGLDDTGAARSAAARWR